MITEIQNESPVAVTAKKGSPWSNLSRGLKDDEWNALKIWRENNPELAYKRRDRRLDGRIFWGYSRMHSGGEKWLTPESAEIMYATNRGSKRAEYAKRWKRKKYKSSPEYRARVKAASRAYYLANREHADEKKRIWWRNKYASDPEFRRKCLDKCKARTAKFGHYCERDVLRRMDSVSGNRKLIRRIYKHCVSITKMTGISHEVDHIIPVKHDGPHHEFNLQILPEKINGEKKDNPFWTSDGCYLDWRNVPRFLWPEKLRPEYELLITLNPKTSHAKRVGFKGRPAPVYFA